MNNKINRFFKGLHRGQKGITGLETAIILIAFVTVASVLAYSVLSAGIFSSEKGKETVYAGLNQASSSMQVQGDVLALASDGATVDSVQFTLASVLQDAPVDMTPPGDDHANVVVINYSDASQQVQDVPWTMARVGASHTGDDMLENNEQMVISVDLSGLDTAPAAYGTFTIQIVPPAGASITITRTLPGTIADVVDLH
jgi:flagellin FlaB